MEAVARTTGVRISTRKVRLVADAIRNMPVAKAMQVLLTTQKHGSYVLIKTLKSAVANAVQKGAQEADLFIVHLEIDGGSTLRRMHIGSRSHVRMYTKRSTHIRFVVSDLKNAAKQADVKREIALLPSSSRNDKRKKDKKIQQEVHEMQRKEESVVKKAKKGKIK